MFTASQIIAALIDRLGGQPVTLTIADVTKYQTKWPTLVTGNEDDTITVSISPDTIPMNIEAHAQIGSK
jgi:hypothetical protein